MLVGIPVLMDSRLEIYVVGGGFGIINRIIQVTTPISIYCTMYILLVRLSRHEMEKLIAKFYLIVLIIFGLLSGSRTFMLPIVFGFYFFLFLNGKICKNAVIEIYTEHSRRLIVVVGILMFISVGISKKFNILAVAGTIAERIVSYGDVFFASYPNSLIEQVQGVSLFNFIFGDLFRALRLVPLEFVQQPIGFEIYNLANNTIAVLKGPNPRHNVLGYINWGFYGSIVFSFCCGILLSLGRNVFYNSSQKTQLAKIVAMLFYASVVNIETDPPFFVASLTNMLLIAMVVVIIQIFIQHETIPRDNHEGLQTFENPQ